MEGPLRGTFDGGYLLLHLAKGEIVVPQISVRSFEIRRPNPGKTAALVGGLIGGGVLVATAISAAASLGHFNVGGY